MRTARNTAHDLAAALGLVSAVRSVRERRHAGALARCVPQGMILGATEFTETDVVVAHARAHDGRPPVVVKLARSASGARSLRRSAKELGALQADPRLHGWEVPRPEILDMGELDGLPYVVESALAGVTIARALDRGMAWQPLAALAAQAIDGMHRRTAEVASVGQDLLERCIERPIQAVEPLVAGSPRRANALAELRRELTERLGGRDVSTAWTHGDYVPGNVLINAEATRVTGIVDWELADEPDLPAIDRGMFLLATHQQTTRSELGAVVAAIVCGDASTSLRTWLVQTVRADLDGQVDARTIALLCWLRHVGALVTRSARYARYRAWKRDNVSQVLDALARHRTAPHTGVGSTK